MVRAGAHSLEFCGGTHVDALGMIGPITVVSEGSIGSNTRRIEAVTGARLARPAGREPAHRRRGGPPAQGGARRRARRPAEGARPPAPGRQGAAAPARGPPPSRTRPASPSAPTTASWCTARTALRPDQLRDLAQAIRRHGARRGGGGGVARRVQGRAWRWPRATTPSTPASTVKELAAAGRRRRRRLGRAGRGGRVGPGEDRRPAGRGTTPARCLTRAGGLSAVRVVGVDLGERRIGVAVSDGTGTLASPRCTDRTQRATPTPTGARWSAVVEEVGARRVVVGLPLSLNGRRGPAARAAQADADELARAARPPGHRGGDLRRAPHDGERGAVAARRGPHGPHASAPDRPGAAAVLLQAWLDTRARPRRCLTGEGRPRPTPTTDRRRRRRPGDGPGRGPTTQRAQAVQARGVPAPPAGRGAVVGGRGARPRRRRGGVVPERDGRDRAEPPPSSPWRRGRRWGRSPPPWSASTWSTARSPSGSISPCTARPSVQPGRYLLHRDESFADVRATPGGGAQRLRRDRPAGLHHQRGGDPGGADRRA